MSNMYTFVAVSQRVYLKIHIYTSTFVFLYVITVNQVFAHCSSHKTREKEHRYASGAPHQNAPVTENEKL